MATELNFDIIEPVDSAQFANIMTVNACGLGDWIIEIKIGTECIEWIGYRNVTGQPCVWSQWIEVVTANVSFSDDLRPKPSILFLSNNVAIQALKLTNLTALL